MNQTVHLIAEALKNSGRTEFSRPEVVEIAKASGLNPSAFLNLPQFRARRGVYTLDAYTPKAKVKSEVSEVSPLKIVKLEDQNLVPEKDVTYVKCGHHGVIKKIIESNIFYPVYISGLSGNGKTMTVRQVCAELKRECIRINISIETDEDDLIGGFTLVEGNIVYREGPMLLAMRRGSVVILDEVDRGSNKLMCLQAILEGNPFFNKKTGETIHPAAGFNVFATANTKGQGTDDGKYMSAQILDDAFIERFAVALDQEFPSKIVEKRILINNMELTGAADPQFADLLVEWADQIRKTYADGGCEDVISTRRLTHIVKAFSIFEDRMKAIELCVSRYTLDTKEVFMEVYRKLDETVNRVVPTTEGTDEVIQESF